jgi:transposase
MYCGPYRYDDHTLESIEGTESCDAELVCRLLRKLRAANPGKRLLVVLDNARYQRARLVQALARRLRIQLLFLPPYSPNLNLIERFWKFLRKKVTCNTNYAPLLTSVPPFSGCWRMSAVMRMNSRRS